MSHNYEKLLSKVKVGAVELRNRIIFGAHPTNFARNNTLTDQHVAYYRERAKGGAGMIILEEQLVHPSDWPYENALFGYLSDIIPSYRKLAETVHDYGSVVVAQLNHSGMQSEGTSGMRELWAPSAVPDVVSREVPKAMEESDIREVIAGYAKVASHVVQGELDGVEINAAQFSLIRQFMSSLTNQRADQYGGDLNNRLRFCVEILSAVRAVLGRDKLLGIRLCGDEFAPWGGLTTQDAIIIAQQLEKLNVLDYITVSVGSLYSLHLSMATYYSEQGLAVDAASKIKEVVKLPVFAEGRIHRPDYAARIVEQGWVDGVYMNRALICDPELPAKISRREGDRVRGCLACNQGCQVRNSMGKPLSCIINPSAGVESKEEISEIKAVGLPKKVLIVGSGPGGMEAARVTALRGHRVTLWESEPCIGGQLAFNSEISEFSRLLESWKKELAALEVRVITGKPCEPEDVITEAPDVVIVATGSKTVEPKVTVKGCLSKSALEVLKDSNGLGKTILFWDEIGNQLMARAVEKLLAEGKKLILVTPDLFAGNNLTGTMELSIWNQHIMASSTEIITSGIVKEVKGSQAIIELKFSGQTLTITDIDAFVYYCWSKPNDSLYLALKDEVPIIYRIGDCLAPRGLGAAVREGYLVGKSI